MGLAAVKNQSSGEYVWSLPGAPIRIHIPLALVEQFRQCLESSGAAERGGILLGNSRGARIDVSGFELFDRANDDHHFDLSPSETLDLAAKIAHRAPDVVGYFRTDLRGRVRLTDVDVTVIKNLFRDPSYVFLVMSTDEAGEPIGGFFFWDGDTLFSEISFKEFPLDPLRLPNALSRSQELQQQQPRVSAPPPDSAIALRGGAPGPQAGSTKRSSRRWLALAAFVASALALGLVLMKLPLPIASHTDQPQPTASAPRPVFGSALLLSARRTGDSVAITWNSAGPALTDARTAVVTVQDGDSKQEFALTEERFRTNKLIYFPRSSQIDVSVEVFSKSGDVVREAMVVAIGESSIRTRTVTPTVVATAPPQTAEEQTPAASARPVRRLEAGTLAAGPRSPERAIDYVPIPEGLPVGLSSANIKAPEFLQRSSAPSWLPQPPTVAPVRPEVTASIEAARPVRQIQPVVPASVLAMLKKPVSVQIRVTVDAMGRVTAAAPVSTAAGINQYLATSAASSARLWTFKPARRDNTPVPSEVILKFDFSQK
jgi:hypothetical protein